MNYQQLFFSEQFLSYLLIICSQYVCTRLCRVIEAEMNVEAMLGCGSGGGWTATH
jgi:hypothetical protein